MATMLDRGDSYRVQYLGSNMLTVTAVTGLGVLQKPLMQMYFRFHKDAARASIRLPERHLIMNDKGMIVSCEAREGSADVTEFYGMPSILFWDAVQFVTVKTADKKLKGAFEPLDNDHSRKKDNLLVTVEKSFHFLHKKQHPPLFCCVLRRTQGLKALDVHAFLCYSDDEAIGLVRALNAVHESYVSEEQQETGVFGYNPFGKESIRSAAGLQRAVLGDQLSSDKEGVGDKVRGQSQQSRSSEVTAQQGSKFRARTARAISVRTRSSKVKANNRTVSQESQLLTGSQPNLSVYRPGHGTELQAGASGDHRADRDSRVFLLSQADFASQPSLADPDSVEADDAAPSEASRIKSQAVIAKQPTRGNVEHTRRNPEKLEKGRSSRKTGSSGADVSGSQVSNRPMRHDRSSRYHSSAERTEPDNDEVNGRLSFEGRGIFQEDNNYLPDEKRRQQLSKLSSNMGQGYSLLSGSSGPPPGYAPHMNARQPYAPSPSAVTGSRLDPDDSSQSMKRDHSVRHAPYNINELDGRLRKDKLTETGPTAYPVPIIPPRSPIFRKSGTLKKEINIAPERKQTIQGTVMAQVTPQSERGTSPFTSRRGPPGVNRDGVGSSAWDREPLGSNASNQTPTPARSKPIAKVQPHKVQGVKVLPSQPSLLQQDGSRPPGGNIHKGQDNLARERFQNISGRDDVIHQKRPNSMFVDKYRDRHVDSTNQYYADQKGISVEEESPVKDIYAVPMKHKKDFQKSKPHNTTKPQDRVTNWQFQKTPEKDSMANKDGRSSANSATNFDDGHGESLIQSEKKDAEIASLLQNIKFDYEATLAPHAPHGTNFEKSLGYFP